MYLLDTNIIIFLFKNHEKDLIVVTNNVSHLGRMEGIIIEDWTK